MITSRTRSIRNAALVALATAGLVALTVTPAHAAETISGTSSPQNLFAESALSEFELAPGDEEPAGSVVSPDGTRLYVAAADDDRVVIFDTETGAIVGGFDTGNEPRGLAISSDGTTVYVANETLSGSVTVAVNDVVTTTIPTGILSFPFAVALSPDDSILYVVRPLSVDVRDAVTGALIENIPTGVVVRGLTVSPDGSKVYVFSLVSDEVSVIDTATNAITDTIEVGWLPTGIAITEDGSTVWVSTAVGNVVPIDTATDTPGTPIPTGSSPLELQVSPDGNWIYALLANGNVGVVDAATGDLEEFNAGILPFWLSISPDGSRLYVSNWGDDNVSVFDIVPLSFEGPGEIDKGTAITTFDVMFGDGSNPMRQPHGDVKVEILDDADNVLATSVMYNPGVADGTLQVDVPTGDLAVGSYTVRATWEALDNTIVAEADGFLVNAVLPATGVEAAGVLGGAMLLLLVGGALVVARRTARA